MKQMLFNVSEFSDESSNFGVLFGRVYGLLKGITWLKFDPLISLLIKQKILVKSYFKDFSNSFAS